MLQKIKEYQFNKTARRLLANERNRKFVNYSSAKTVFVLFESDLEEKNQVVMNVIRLLQRDGKKVTAWGYVPKKEVTTSIMLDFRIIPQKQADFFGKPIPSLLNELAQLEFDLLIDLTLKPVIPLQYLALNANAWCKTGLKKNELPVYDFMIDAVPSTVGTEESEHVVDEMYLFNQIFFYLKSIQTND